MLNPNLVYTKLDFEFLTSKNQKQNGGHFTMVLADIMMIFHNYAYNGANSEGIWELDGHEIAIFGVLHRKKCNINP